MHTIDAILVHKPYMGGGFKLITTRQNQTQQYPHSIHKKHMAITANETLKTRIILST
jgi:hypothetical protein